MPRRRVAALAEVRHRVPRRAGDGPDRTAAMRKSHGSDPGAFSAVNRTNIFLCAKLFLTRLVGLTQNDE